jgi:hypothetical protein
VSTDSGGGTREILMEGRFGSLVRCNDKVALAEAIENELRQPRSPEVQRAAALRYLPERVVKEFLQLVH